LWSEYEKRTLANVYREGDTMGEPAEVSARTFRHEAAFYDGLESLVDVLVPFVREGLEAGEPVLVAELPRQTRALREALGSDADAVTFLDMEEAGRNPACIIPVWREFVSKNAGRSVRGIGEPAWSGRRDVELEECRLHEALLNVAFDDTAMFRLLCPYDVGGLPSAVVIGAMRTHPELGDGLRHAPYDAHDHAREVFAQPLPPSPDRAQAIEFGPCDLSTLRTSVRFIGEGARLTEEVVDDLVLAVHELACNSIEHGGGRGVMRGWCESDSLVLEVADRGVIDDPLIGREEVIHLSEDGRGIWMANHLCDLVQVRSGACGTAVRLHTWT
jgi:anti-sigma regulatory factor (Ser/Thr protein kinase)